MKKFALFGFFVLANTQAANYRGIEYSIEPLYGREKSQISGSNYLWSYYYGARISVRYDFIGGEFTYTRTDSGTLLGAALNESNGFEVEKLKIGILAPYAVTPELNLLGRIGGSAKRVTEYNITGFTLNRIVHPPTYAPYIGIGAEYNLLEFLAVTASATVTFNGIPDDLFNNDYEFSGGVRFFF